MGPTGFSRKRKTNIREMLQKIILIFQILTIISERVPYYIGLIKSFNLWFRTFGLSQFIWVLRCFTFYVDENKFAKWNVDRSTDFTRNNSFDLFLFPDYLFDIWWNILLHSFPSTNDWLDRRNSLYSSPAHLS